MVRILWRIIVVGSVLFTGGSAVRAGLSAIFIRCWEEKTDLPSPDGKHIAHRRVHICQGPLVVNETVNQVIDIGRTDIAGLARVYESRENDSNMRWEDNDHLRIDITSNSTIELSLHQGNGVHVAYHVPRRLISLQSQDALEQQEEEMHRTGKTSDAAYAFGKKINRDLRLWDEQFIQWASENAVIDDDRK